MIPLAQRCRPNSLEHFIGQEHLTGENSILKKYLDTGNLPSIILWGPPGTGKTTLAQIISKTLDAKFYSLNAVHSGVKDIRQILDEIQEKNLFQNETSINILFIDEIHRFNKSQQDSLLQPVEKGIITLIGATTENPSFEVNSALLSRCQVYRLNLLSKEAILKIFHLAIQKDSLLKNKKILLKEKDKLIQYSSGDARKLLNILEIIANQKNQEDKIIITNAFIDSIIKENMLMYDKKGDNHYDVISAFIKSIRGSNVDATLYWLARMIVAGEDVKFIARRLIISAAEDIGLANPNALMLANTTFEAVEKIGLPEARIILSQCAVYLAMSKKNNSAYIAINKAIEKAKESGNLPVPLHLRNAVTDLMKKEKYGVGYKYPHDYKDSQIEQEYLPKEIQSIKFFKQP